MSSKKNLNLLIFIFISCIVRLNLLWLSNLIGSGFYHGAELYHGAWIMCVV